MSLQERARQPLAGPASGVLSRPAEGTLLLESEFMALAELWEVGEA